MLTYDWIKIIAIVLASIVLWQIIFQTAKARLTTGQDFGVFYFSTIKNNTANLNALVDEEDCFSYDVLRYYSYFMDENYNDYFLQTRASTSEGDIFVVDNVLKPMSETLYLQDARYSHSNFKSIVDVETFRFYDYDLLVSDAKNYIAPLLKSGLNIDVVMQGYQPETNGFDKSLYFTENFDASKIEALFNERMGGDRRFITNESKIEGRKNEIKRIKALFENVCDFDYLLKTHPGLFVEYTRYEYLYFQAMATNETSYYEMYKPKYEAQTPKKYAINTRYLTLNTTASKPPATNYFSVFNVEDTKNEPYILVYNYKNEQPHLQYETMSLLTSVIKRCSTLLDARR